MDEENADVLVLVVSQTACMIQPVAVSRYEFGATSNWRNFQF